MINYSLLVEVSRSSTELYDVKGKMVTLGSCKIGRIAPGICYNEGTKRVYVAGGFVKHDECKHEKTVELYDFVKNKWWMDIPEMNNIYKGHPVMWMEGDDLLYIASVPSGVDGLKQESCEFIDLRVGKKWEVVYEDKMVIEMFGVVATTYVQSYLLML